MGKRIFSTVLLWTIVGSVLWFTRTTGAIVLTTLISVLTLREFYVLMHGAGYDPFDKFGMTFGAAITLGPWLHSRFGLPADLFLAFSTVIFAIRLLGERTPETRVEALASTLFGIIYVPFMLSYLVAIITPLPGDTLTADGRLLLALWLVAVAKFCDTGALLTGLAIGRHKMSPQISPKKTWEGAAGGICTSMGVGALIAWLARDHFPPHLTPGVAALLAAPIGAVAIVADLIESVIKRRANIKDSGSTIPGIGGMFDLSDSIILVAPLGYLIFRLP
ncbi:MAG: phosphatidate cytidylyltransferase [Verrucomicrobia bacterium]|nr:phosphatidate cytidylyltransferase [Verrucomicrobiota bacterium]